MMCTGKWNSVKLEGNEKNTADGNKNRIVIANSNIKTNTLTQRAELCGVKILSGLCCDEF